MIGTYTENISYKWFFELIRKRLSRAKKLNEGDEKDPDLSMLIAILCIEAMASAKYPKKSTDSEDKVKDLLKCYAKKHPELNAEYLYRTFRCKLTHRVFVGGWFSNVWSDDAKGPSTIDVTSMDINEETRDIIENRRRYLTITPKYIIDITEEILENFKQEIINRSKDFNTETFEIRHFKCNECGFSFSGNKQECPMCKDFQQST